MSDATWRRTWTAVAVVAAGLFVWWVLDTTRYDYVLVLRYAVTGLGPGAVAALSGVALVITYQTTGIFNFAQGAIASFMAFVLWQLVTQWGLPLLLAAPLTLLVAGPFLGVLIERQVFRPLQRRGASTSEKLLATIALFAVFIGLMALIWGLDTKSEVPRLFGFQPIDVFGPRFVVGQDTVAQLGIVLVAAGGVTALLRYTTLGTQMRAVVDRRQLAELAGVRANRVAAISWALGCGFAGVVGVLYAPSAGLSPYSLTLLVLQTFGVAAIARLTNLWLAVVGGLALGVVQSLMLVVNPQIVAVWQGFQQLQPGLLVLALPLFILIYRNLDEAGAADSGTGGLVAGAVGRTGRLRLAPRATLLVAAVGVGFVLPGELLVDAQAVLAMAVVFVSIVAVTGFSGHITLGQAAFAGLGAFLSAKLANGAIPGLPQLPVIAATLAAATVVMVLGLATGYPALRRRGLILGVATLAVNLALSALLFENFFFTETGTAVAPRPGPFSGDRAFYWYELAWLALVLAFAGGLRSGRLGRILAAMRDSSPGATSIGISLRRYKLFIFAASSFIAGIGGALLAQQSQSFTPGNYSPLFSLFWFLAVVFCGLSYLSGGVLAAVLFVGLDAAVGQSNASVFIIGMLALMTIGRLRDGLVGATLRLAAGRGVPEGLREEYAAAARPAAPQVAANGQAPDLVPSPHARKVLEEARK